MKVVLKRKIDDFLVEWKSKKNKNLLIIKGGRKIGKTFSIEKFGKLYKSFITINFLTQPEYKQIFTNGFEIINIIKEISIINPSFVFIPGKTLIFFDEVQNCPEFFNFFKFIKIDDKYDFICADSFFGINLSGNTIIDDSFCTIYDMYSLDFEEFLWAKGFDSNQIENIYGHLKSLIPFSTAEYNVLLEIFREFVISGGMPAVVRSFIEQQHFSGTLNIQKEILQVYREDIVKYVNKSDREKVKKIYNNISNFLYKSNKKFQISKIEKCARNREYNNAVNLLKNSGIVNICYCLKNCSFPLSDNYKINDYKIYFNDISLLIASFDTAAQIDLRNNKNFNTFKGAIYESFIADSLKKQGFELFYFKNEKSTAEITFFISDSSFIIPIEVKDDDKEFFSYKKFFPKENYSNIKYGIKFCNKNLNYNGEVYTIPFFCSFLLKRFIMDYKF